MFEVVFASCSVFKTKLSFQLQRISSGPNYSPLKITLLPATLKQVQTEYSKLSQKRETVEMK